jgi:predicted DCC family thiol-disulfide oxidoreductase YuxK
VEVIFDGDCAICQASVDWLTRRDALEVISARPSSSLPADDAASLPIADTVVVRDPLGVVVVRSTAVATTLACLPGGWGLLGRQLVRILQVPPVRVLGDGAYNLVARNRIAISRILVRMGLLTTACRVPAGHD